jgi:hypothetical protein
LLAGSTLADEEEWKQSTLVPTRLEVVPRRWRNWGAGTMARLGSKAGSPHLVRISSES